MERIIEFDFSTQNLYEMTRLGWDFCNENLQAFANLRGRYTTQYVIDQLKLVDQAEALPMEEQRNSVGKEIRLRFERATEAALGNWQLVKFYMEEAYDADELPIMLEKAGAGYYERAAGGNWASVLRVLNLGRDFIEENEGTLKNGDNMPGTFAQEYNDSRDKCVTLARQYFASGAKKSDDAGDKIAANNAVYKSFVRMCKDGQRIYAKNPDMKRKFVIGELLTMVGKGGVAGFKGLMRDSVTKTPLANVVITDSTGKYRGVTDAFGKFHIKRMIAGTYLFTFVVGNYAPVTREIVLKPRRTKQLTLGLVEMLIEVAA